MKYLITGGAGFIGASTVKALIDRGDEVVLLDNFNDYYDPQLKEDRLRQFLKNYQFKLYRADIRDKKEIEKVFQQEKIDKVLHLAAMAGVRNSLKDPILYEEVNIQGTIILLDLSVKYKIKNFVYASSSSVYGNNKKMPFSEKDSVDFPISIYAATKKADELMAHAYRHLYGLKTTGLRYFTVYGPWGRPDMALFLFLKNILTDKPIEVYNYGKMSRNFTYIDDIVAGNLTVLDADLDYDVVNIGGEKADSLLKFIACIEKYTGKKAKQKLMPMQPGDVPKTLADISKLKKLGWSPKMEMDEGIKKVVEWYREYYKV